MFVKFGHRKVPGRFVYMDVDEPFPPQWMVPFIDERIGPITDIDKEEAKGKVAVFEKAQLIGFGSIEIGYVFKEWA